MPYTPTPEQRRTPVTQTPVDAAKAYRRLEEENPWQALALGFTPAGAIGSAAALVDPDAAWWEKALSLPIVGPAGKLAKKGYTKANQIIAGPVGQRRLGIPEDQIQATAEAGGDEFSTALDKLYKNDSYPVRRVDIPDPVLRDDIDMIHGENWKTSFYDLFDQSHPDTKQALKAYPELGRVKYDLTRSVEAPMGGEGGFLRKGDDFSMLESKVLPTGEVEVKFWNPEDLQKVLSHENQHGVQTFEMYPEALRGAAPGNSSSAELEKYLVNPGEREARLNATRQMKFDDALRKEYPLSQHMGDQSKMFIKRKSSPSSKKSNAYLAEDSMAELMAEMLRNPQ